MIAALGSRLLLLLAAMILPLTAALSRSHAEMGDPSQQILVLVRLAPQHYRPGSDYAGSYGADVQQSARQRLATKVARKHGLTLVDEWSMPLIGVDCFIMAIHPGDKPEVVAEAVSHENGVEMSQPMHMFRAQGQNSAGDPLLAAQPSLREWRLNDLHQIATGKGVKVAVIDSKIEASHPDLSGQIVANEDFVGSRPTSAEQHGTAVAGIIAAKEGNGLGIAGIAPEARLLALRACWQTGKTAADTVCDSLSLAKALYFALEHNAQVVNLSLSGPQDALLVRLLQLGLSRGIAVVAAYDRSEQRGGFPASVPGVIAVADEPLSPYVPTIYVAPGRDVPTTEPGGKWYLVNGSSFAAAHVSGLVALVREHKPRNGPVVIVANRAGGAIDACATVLRSFPCECTCASGAGAVTRRP